LLVPLQEEAGLRIGKNGTARELRMAVLSLAVHGCMLALVTWIGVFTRSKVVDRTENVTVAGLEDAGGSHAVEIQLPTRLTAADMNKPERYADAAVPPTLVMRQLRP